MSLLEPEHRTLHSSGVPLHVWDYAAACQRQDPVVLFLHGFLDTGRSFEFVIQHLIGHCRPLCLDWRGHGFSQPAPPGGSHHQLDHLKDLALALDELADPERGLGVRPQLVVAHSLGAIVGFIHAAVAPDQVDRYLFLDACGGFTSPPQEQVDALTRMVKASRKPPPAFRIFRDASAAVDRIMVNNPGLSRKGAELMVLHATEATADGRVQFRFDSRLRGPNPLRLSEDTWRELGARVQAEVRVLLGETGIIDRVPDITGRIETIRNSSWQTVHGCGHHLHLDAPATVAENILQLLSCRKPESGSR
ncbi:MAG: alpha/beta hydrolase [Planctomycetes bacterium]|nr:alpha/beta hydrolase [Planctomycetota bacterium]